MSNHRNASLFRSEDELLADKLEGLVIVREHDVYVEHGDVTASCNHHGDIPGTKQRLSRMLEARDAADALTPGDADPALLAMANRALHEQLEEAHRALVDAAIDRRMLARAVPVDDADPCPVCLESWCWSVSSPVGSAASAYCDRHDHTRGPWLVRVESGDVLALAAGDVPYLFEAHRLRREAETRAETAETERDALRECMRQAGLAAFFRGGGKPADVGAHLRRVLASYTEYIAEVEAERDALRAEMDAADWLIIRHMSPEQLHDELHAAGIEDPETVGERILERVRAALGVRDGK